jgi:cytochrome P450
MLDWTTINLYNVLAIVVGRISARILVGPELARNDDWLALQGRVAFDLKEAAEGVRTRYPPWFRWAARYFFAPVKKVIASRRRAVELLRPLLEAREAALKTAVDGEKPRFNDGVQWLVAAYEAEGRKLTAEELALHELFIAFGALESNLGALVGILFDLVDHPEHVRELEEEIAAVRKDSPNLPRQALNKLWKLDAFIKESQRIRPLGIGMFPGVFFSVRGMTD